MINLDEFIPQTKDGLKVAREQLGEELKKRNMTGVPSIDKPWTSNYTKEQLEVEPPQISMVDYIYERNKDRMHFNAINYKGKKITYEELFYRIDDTAKRFQKYGVKENDYVNLALPVSPETIYMVYGLDKIGAYASLIDPRINVERMQYYLNLVNSRIVGITGLYAKSMRKAIKSSNDKLMINISPLQSIDTKNNEILKLAYNLKMIPENVKELLSNLTSSNKIISSRKFYSGNMSNYELKIPKYKENKTAIVEYTSGTTGVPKGLELSDASINLVAEQLKDLIDLNPGETVLGIMPPFSSYGIVCGTHVSLSSGLESILIPNFSPDIFPELVIKHKPNNIMCVPSFLQILMNSDLINKNTDLSFIRNIIIGGNKMGVEFEKEFNTFLREHNSNITVFKGGGMSEYSSCMFFTPKNTNKPGVYGIPLPSVDAKIVDENGKELGYYEIGEIHVSSKQNMNGYVNNQKATDEFFYIDENGKKFGRTGDLGYININGIFVLLDRKKRMIIRPDGYNIFPSLISSVILEHYAVEDCVVSGKKDDVLESGEFPVAFIKIKDEYLSKSNKIMAEISKLCTQKLPPRDRPREEDYIQVKEIINTSEGKPDLKSTIAEENYINNKMLIKDMNV